MKKSKMMKMLSLILMYLLHNIHGHSDNNNLELRNDADLQAELIPQELNTQFVPQKVSPKDSPWHVLLPIAARNRRNTQDVPTIDANAQELLQAQTGLSHNFKMYTRVASCVALVVAAIIEIVLYVLEFYK